MNQKRPTSLKWVGAMLPDGRPARFLDFLLPADIDEARIAELTPEQLTIVRNHPDLYREAFDKQKSTTARPEGATAAIAADPAPEPDTTDEAVTEGEGE